MKEKILNFFKHDRSYSEAIKLYNEIGQRLSLKRQFNSYPEADLKPVLFEEFRQMAGISPAEFQNMMKTKVHPVQEKEFAAVVVPPAPMAQKAPKTAKKPAATKATVKKASSPKPVTKKVIVKKVVIATPAAAAPIKPVPVKK